MKGETVLRFLFVWGLVVLALAQAGCGSESGDGAQPGTQAAGDEAVAAGEEGDVAGASVRVADTITASRIVLDGGSEYEADGTYLLVRLVLEPAGSEAARLSDREVVLLGGNGETYEVDKLGTMAIVRGNRQTSQYDPAKPNGLYGPIEVALGATADLAAVFDVPQDAVSDLRLQIGPRGSTRVFELEPDTSVNPTRSDLGVRLVQ
jgi:hypothetical protein